MTGSAKKHAAAIPVTMQAPAMIMRAQPDYGGMTVSFNELPKGTDITRCCRFPEHSSCHGPHGDYIGDGVPFIKYNNGEQDLLHTGDVFYSPPGHTGIAQEDVKLPDYSPSKEFNEVMEHIGKKRRP